MTRRIARFAPILAMTSLAASFALVRSPVFAADPAPDFQLPLECGQTDPDQVPYYGARRNPHNGSGVHAVDFNKESNWDWGDEVLASAGGDVIVVDDGQGMVIINHPNGWQTIYGHMAISPQIEDGGEPVQIGELLGFIDAYGDVRGDPPHHLHYEQNEWDGTAWVSQPTYFNGQEYSPPWGADPWGYPITSDLCFLDPPFTDHFDSPFRGEINWLYQDQKQALGGTISYEHPVFSCDTIRYCELETVSRAAVAVFLAEFLRLPPPTADHFDDDNGLPEEAAINRVADAGVAGGCGVRLYCPNFTASRDHMAVYLVRALDLEDELPIGDHFDDDDGPFEDEINVLADRGIVTGCGGRNYCPSSAVSKDHLAVFLYNARFQP